MKITWNETTDDFGNSHITKTDENGVIWYVPKDEANSDYQAYLAHLTESLPQ